MKHNKFIFVIILIILIIIFISKLYNYYPLNYVMHPDDSGVVRAINNFAINGSFNYQAKLSESTISGMSKINNNIWAPLKMVGEHIYPTLFMFLYNNPFIINIFLLTLLGIFLYLILKDIFQDPIISLISTFLLISFSPILFWSSSFYTCFSLLFFVFCCYYYYRRLVFSNNTSDYILFVFFANISIIFRYEMIVFYLILFIYTLFTKNKFILLNLKRIVILFLISTSILSVIPLYNHVSYGNMFITGYSIYEDNLINKNVIIKEKNKTQKENVVKRIFSSLNKTIKFFTARLFEVNVNSLFRNIYLFIYKFLTPIFLFLIILFFVFLFNKSFRNKLHSANLDFLIIISLFILFFYGKSQNYYIYSKILVMSSYVRYFMPIYILILMLAVMSLCFLLLKLRNSKIIYIASILLMFYLISRNIDFSIDAGLKEANLWINRYSKVHSIEKHDKNAVIITNTLDKALVIAESISPKDDDDINEIIKNLQIKGYNVYIAEETNHPYYKGYIDKIDKMKFNYSLINRWPVIIMFNNNPHYIEKTTFGLEE